MKKEINNKTINELKYFKGRMLLYDGRMFYIKDYKIEEEAIQIKGNFLRKEKTIKKQYLTSLNIITYFNNYKTTGTMTESSSYYIIQFFNISVLRDNWLTFAEQLKAFGVHFIGK